MASFRLPNTSKVQQYNYTGVDEDGNVANITYSFVRINDCLIDMWEDMVSCVYDDVDDSDCEFIIGAITGRLTDQCAQKYGFSSAEDAYDELDSNGSGDIEEYAKFFERCRACGKAYPEPDADKLMYCITSGSSDIWVNR